MSDTKEVRERLQRLNRLPSRQCMIEQSQLILDLCDELDALRQPVEACPMCHGAGVVERRVAYSDKVDDPCPACARINVLEAENRRLREDGERMRAEIQRMRHEPAAPF